MAIISAAGTGRLVALSAEAGSEKFRSGAQGTGSGTSARTLVKLCHDTRPMITKKLLMLVCAFSVGIAMADDVEKVLFLVVERSEVIASNTKAGRFDSLQLKAKEIIKEHQTGNAVAVVVTNQRFSAYGVDAGGWQSIRREAGEKTESIQVEDYSATVVTNDRILNFYGRTGAWNQVRRSVQFRR